MLKGEPVADHQPVEPFVNPRLNALICFSDSDE
jgi:hypothetical protein